MVYYLIREVRWWGHWDLNPDQRVSSAFRVQLQIAWAFGARGTARLYYTPLKATLRRTGRI